MSTLAVIAPSPDLASFPLGPSLELLANHYRLTLLTLRPEPKASHRIDVVQLEDLGLPGASLRFALEDDDLAALTKPAFLSLVSGQTDEEVILVHGNSLIDGKDGLIFSKPMFQHDLELLPALPIHLAKAKPGMDSAFDAGLGDPTGRVLRFRPTANIRGLLEEWRGWMTWAYATDPTLSLVDAELTWLRALPASYPSVGWSHEPVIALWSDLHPEHEPPRLIDTTGFLEYRESVGLAYSLMERRTHSGAIVDETGRRLEQPWIEPRPRFESGPLVDPSARKILRAVDPLGSRWADPAVDDNDRSYRIWLQQRDSRHLPRFAQALYWARPDLQQSFPARTTPVMDFVHWLSLNHIGVDDAAIGPEAEESMTDRAIRVMGRRLGFKAVTLAARRRVAGSPDGINTVGFASAETGLGEAMRGTLRAARSSGREVAVLDFSNRIYARQGESEMVERPLGAPHDITVFHLNPTELIDYAKDVLAYRFAANRLIGFFFWETERIPDRWVPACDMVDEIWVASTYLKTAFAQVTDKPIHVVGMSVEVPPDVMPDRQRFGIAESDFVVSYVTDAYSGLERKDPIRAIRAFDMAFGPDFDGTHLLLKVGNLEKFPALRHRIQEETEAKPITIVAEYLSRLDLWSLLASADVYLSLHASEGFGLTILEAMALAVPPVVTAYGGNMDFTTPDNSLLVGFSRSPARGGPANIYEGNGSWANPDLDEAAHHLGALRFDESLRARLGDAARSRASEFGFEKFRDRISRLLDNEQ